jgi:hypothetical protein
MGTTTTRRLIPAPPLLAALLISTLSSSSFAQPATQPPGGYLFTYFLNNGQDGLHLATSPDGLHWQVVGSGQSFLKPIVGKEKLMRDPCVLLGPDGVYRLVWTDSWADRTIGYSSSTDLVHWTDQQALPVMSAEPTALNTWAPEVHYDAVNKHYVIFWASTIPGRFPDTDASGDKAANNQRYNHRIYSTTTTDFENFTPTRLYFDPGFDCIDATLIPVNGRICLIFKDETLTPTKKNLRLAWSDSMDGPYTDVSEPFTRPWVEGPTAIQIGDYKLVYFDCYRDHHYGAMRSKDMKTWQDITDQLSMPPGIRHGTVIAVSAQVMTSLAAASPAPNP